MHTTIQVNAILTILTGLVTNEVVLARYRVQQFEFVESRIVVQTNKVYCVEYSVPPHDRWEPPLVWTNTIPGTNIIGTNIVKFESPGLFILTP